MGVVYRARYVVNGRQVALKMLPSDMADKTALARFERELEVLKTLRHPNIVRCFGGVCEDKRRFYAMELLEGGSLEDQLQAKGLFPWEQVIQYGLQMCEALRCSHEKGVIHRDVKPSNFLMTPTGRLKLSDFGLASVNASNKITAAGKTAGTFLYMAPEQIRGQEITPRTDLYALGCVLFELVTGEVPFLGETAGATLHLHCFSSPPRPTEKALDCPVQLERIILKLLEKDAAKRFESAETVSRELLSVQQTVIITSPLEQEESYLAGEWANESIGIEKKTEELPRRYGAGPGTSVLISLVSVLALSLLINGFLWRQYVTATHWRNAWKETLTSSQPTIRIEGIRTLGRMVEYDPSQLKNLVKLLEDPEPEIRIAAITAIGEANYESVGHVPLLIKVQKNDISGEVRHAAGFAIERIRSKKVTSGGGWLGYGFVLVLMGTMGGAAYWYWTRENEQRVGFSG